MQCFPSPDSKLGSHWNSERAVPYGLLVESIAEGGDKRVGLHFCPFLRALAQTITMLDHYVNYPKKTKIVTERQPHLRSRPLNSDMHDDKQEDNKTPIVVG